MQTTKNHPTKVQINLTVHKTYAGQVNSGLLERAARAALEAARVSGAVELDILVTSDSKVKTLNSTYRGIDEVTDVLAFGLSEGKAFPSPDGVLRPGEVVLAYPRCVKQASEYGHSVEQEAALLTIHGTLHLLGYDHEASLEEARRMRKAEKVALLAMGLPNISRI
jgi:probable rRNA maturation factor